MPLTTCILPSCFRAYLWRTINLEFSLFCFCPVDVTRIVINEGSAKSRCTRTEKALAEVCWLLVYIIVIIRGIYCSSGVQRPLRTSVLYLLDIYTRRTVLGDGAVLLFEISMYTELVICVSLLSVPHPGERPRAHLSAGGRVRGKLRGPRQGRRHGKSARHKHRHNSRQRDLYD